MQFAYNLGSNDAPRVQKYQVSATLAAGIVALRPGANDPGIVTSTTTSFTDAIGLVRDGTFETRPGISGTYQTAQQADGSNPERIASVIINPDACYEALISGAAAEGTALTLYDVTTASSDGLAVTTGDDWTNPEFDEGAIWGFDGANAGIVRKITSTSSTAATVIVAFPRDTVVGDNFLRAPFWPGGTATFTLSTLLTQVRGDSAVATNTASVSVVELIAHAADRIGRTTSKVIFKLRDHHFGIST